MSLIWPLGIRSASSLPQMSCLSGTLVTMSRWIGLTRTTGEKVDGAMPPVICVQHKTTATAHHFT